GTAASDHAGAGRRGLDQHLRRTEAREHRMRDGAVAHRHRDQVLACDGRTLADRVRHFVRLAHTRAHTPLAVTHHDDGGKAEAPAALHNLRHAVDEDDLLGELALAFPAAVPVAALSLSRYHAPIRFTRPSARIP